MKFVVKNCYKFGSFVKDYVILIFRCIWLQENPKRRIRTFGELFLVIWNILS